MNIKDLWEMFKQFAKVRATDDLLQQKLDRIRGEFNQQFNTDNNWSYWVIDASDAFVIAEFAGDKFKIPYQLMDDNVIFAPQNEWQQVEVNYVERAIKEADSWDGDSSRWEDAKSYCESSLISLWRQAGKDEPTKELCFLPVKDPGETQYNSRAIQAAAGGRGISALKKPAEVSQEDFDKAVKVAATKLESLYKEMDKEAPPSVMMAKERAMTLTQIESKAYEEMSEMPMMNYAGAYVDNDGRFYCLGAYDGKLYRCELSIMNDEIEMGNPQEVTQEFVPKTRTQIIRDGQKVRWLSISATATLNRSGEIDSRQLFDNFIKRAEESGVYPDRIFYHTNGKKFVTGKADFLARVGNCYITGGEYNDRFLAQAEIKAREAEPDYWGDSIGYIPIGEADFIRVRGFDIPVYQDGVNIEISTLPTKEAASLFIKTEVKRMNEKQLEALARMSFNGDIDAAKKWIEENPDEVNRQIDEKGLVTRNAEEVTPAEFELTDEVIGVIVERMAENQVIRSLQDKLTEQEGTIAGLIAQVTDLKQALAKTDQRLNEVQRSDAEKVRTAVKELPAASIVKLGYRPSVERKKEDDQRTSQQVAEDTLDSIGLKY